MITNISQISHIPGQKIGLDLLLSGQDKLDHQEIVPGKFIDDNMGINASFKDCLVTLLSNISEHT